MKLRKVILEGCNGEWAQECYLPVLAGKAAKGDIELWAVDIADEIKLSCPQAEKDWQIAQSQNRARYLNKKRGEVYSELSEVNYVFVVAPDQFHSEIASLWLERLGSRGKIFLEKPLDASVEAAFRLKKNIEEKEKKEAIFAFDHYLARTYPLLGHLKEIGEIRKIKSRLLEASEIPSRQKRTLAKGVIFDLFCHVLALVCSVVSKDLTCSATNFPVVKLERVKGARYAGCPIPGETFASIKFAVNNDIEVISAVGKCIGASDEKFMKIYGSEGQIESDFSAKEDSFSIIDSHGERKESWKHKPRHVENFLEELLSGTKHPLSLPGVLSFDAAFEILKILDKAKRQIDKMSEYQCNDSIDKILEILKGKERQ